jgi:acyl-coenzyme A thioesterase PaaI-like protein
MDSETRCFHSVQEAVSNAGNFYKTRAQGTPVSVFSRLGVETTKIRFSGEECYNRVDAGGCSFFVSEDIMDRADEAALLVSSFNYTPFHKLMGLELVVIDREKIIATIEKTHPLSGQVRLLHGGVIAACLDGVGAFQALHEIWRQHEDASPVELVGRGRRLRTTQLQIKYLSAPKSEWFQIAATTGSYRDRVIVSEMEMIDAAGKLVAKGTADYLQLSRSSS